MHVEITTQVRALVFAPVYLGLVKTDPRTAVIPPALWHMQVNVHEIRSIRYKQRAQDENKQHVCNRRY